MPDPHSPIQTDRPADAFAFGHNWSRFLRVVDEDRIATAVRSLSRRLGPERLRGRRFLDAGCGSGLFSLAAHRLGARVVSFDVDRQSVACAEEIRRRWAPDAADWDIRQGSVLDADFLAGLGEFDVVYSWGVLHHTGAMWRALGLIQQRVAADGHLWIALYNDQGAISDRWKRVKKLYQDCPSILRTPYVLVVGSAWAAWRLLCLRVPIALAGLLLRPVHVDAARTPIPDASPLEPPERGAASAPQRQRGMHWWYDLVDWIGGWPFETSRPEDVLLYLSRRGFEIVDLTTCGGGLGCNEFVFRRAPHAR